MGAPPGNRNALKHGRLTNAAKAKRKDWARLRETVRLLKRRAAIAIAGAHRP